MRLLAALFFFTLAAYARKPIQLDLHAPAFVGARRRGLSPRAPVQNATLSQNQETNLNKLFMATMGIGTPPQLINVTIDLVSSDLIIPSNSVFCDGCGFVAAESSSATNASTTTLLRRDNGQPNAIPITGSVFIDAVSINDIQVPVVQFLVAEDIDGGIPAGYEHGFLGMGGTGLSTLDSTPPWQSLLGSNNLRTEFGLWLSRNGTGRAGSFFLGGHDASVYSGAIDFLPVTGEANAFWTLNVTGLSAQGKAINIPAGGQIAQFDMNSPGILAPSAVVNAFWAQVPGATVNGFGSYIFPCNTNVEFSITFGGRDWTIPASDMALEDLGGGDCYGTLVGFNSTTSNQWVIGFQFLKNVYTAYQTAPPMIGIADLSTLAGGTGPPNSTAPIPTSASSSASASLTGAGPSSTALSSSPSPASSHSAPVAAIAGGVVGAVVLIALLLLALFFFLRRRRRPATNLEAPLGEDFSPQEDTSVSPFSSPFTPMATTRAGSKGPLSPPAPFTGSSSGSPPSPDEKRVLGLAAQSRSRSASTSTNTTLPVLSPQRRSRNSPSIVRSRDENDVLRHEVQQLREEVQHWQAVAETVPPPGYFDDAEDARRR